MSSLLELVLEANGAAKFATISRIVARVEYGGEFWADKGHPSFAGTARVEARAHEQLIHQTNVVGGLTMVFDRSTNLVTVAEHDGRIIEVLRNPRRSFDGYTQRSQWSVAQMAYFRCYTTWNYLVEPFNLALAGVTNCEIPERAEHGEHWRGLSATFPDELDTHNRTQLYYFDDAYRLRRTDLQPEVNDFTPTTQYVDEYVEVDGVTLATRRRVYLRRSDRSPDVRREPLEVDISDIQFA